MYKQPELQRDKSTPKATGWYVEEGSEPKPGQFLLKGLVFGPVVAEETALAWAHESAPLASTNIYQVFQVLENGNKTSRKKVRHAKKEG